MGESILPSFLSGENGKKALWVLVGLICVLLLSWGIVSVVRAMKGGNANSNVGGNADVVEPPQPQPQQGGGSDWNNTAEGQKNARDMAQKIFTYLKNGWSFGGWVCFSPQIIPGIIEALSKSTDGYISNVGRFYYEIDDTTKLSALFSQTACQSLLGKGQKDALIARLKTLGL